jgi:hypothetical protein
MAQQKQRWKPDTCRCVIEQTFDSADYEGTVVNSVVSACPAHAVMPVAERPAAAVENNRRKNNVYRRLFEAFQSDMFEQVNGEWQLRSGASFTWAYVGDGAARVLQVVITGMTTQKKAQAQAWCDANLGVGSVVIQ